MNPVITVALHASQQKALTESQHSPQEHQKLKVIFSYKVVRDQPGYKKAKKWRKLTKLPTHNNNKQNSYSTKPLKISLSSFVVFVMKVIYIP